MSYLNVISYLINFLKMHVITSCTLNPSIAYISYVYMYTHYRCYTRIYHIQDDYPKTDCVFRGPVFGIYFKYFSHKCRLRIQQRNHKRTGCRKLIGSCRHFGRGSTRKGRTHLNEMKLTTYYTIIFPYQILPI